MAFDFKKYIGGFGDYGKVIFALSIIGILCILIFPVPNWVLDPLLAISLALSIIILLQTLFIEKPLDFNSFPSILLIATLMRLSLNIASTRLILSNGHVGTEAAGRIIESFGEFVMGGSVMIGIIVFGILTIINFVVITKGSGRIAEVSARFSLDAMPGKQMAIDADLSSGLIDEKTARERRKEVESESNFFGSMDGASKFVRGDAIAGLLITFINFIGGIIIGVGSHGMDFSNAVHTYTILTIGDGLISQIPAIVISIAAGLLVTKSGVSGTTDKAVFRQISNNPTTFLITAGLLMFMGVMPGMPFMVFFLLGLMMIGMYYLIKIFPDKNTRESTEDVKPDDKTAKDPSLSEFLKLDSIVIELGYSLVIFTNESRDGNLSSRIKELRNQVFRELGFIIPFIRIVDNITLGAEEYIIKVKDIEFGKGTAKNNHVMIMNPTGENIDIVGFQGKDPTFGVDVVWASDHLKDDAQSRGYTVVDPESVIITHLTEIIKDNIPDLLTYSNTKKLLDEIGEENKKLVEDIVPEKVSINIIQKVLQRLLSENISIRDLPLIIESIADCFSKDIAIIVEYVRSCLARQISYSNVNKDGHIAMVTLSDEWDKEFSDNIIDKDGQSMLVMPPNRLHEFADIVKKKFEECSLKENGDIPVLLVSPRIRIHVRSIIERVQSSIFILSHNEIHKKVKIKNIGEI